MTSRNFYADLSPIESFRAAMQPQLHTPLPDDWWIAVADIANSTEAIADGNYKEVNSVGVAGIAAITNLDRSLQIPYVFGGDGATFALPGELLAAAQQALRGTQQMARSAFGLELRVGFVSVGELAAAGYWLRLAKVQLSPQAVQTAFSGRGWEEAERRIKDAAADGVLRIAPDDGGPAEADFSGFECRWESVQSFNGHKLALLVAALAEDAATNLQTYDDVFETIRRIYGNESNYHPLRPSALHLALNPYALRHEWRIHARQLSWRQGLRLLGKMWVENVAGLFLFLFTRRDNPTSPWGHYRDDVVDNTDFRKFDGMLRMVIDGNDRQRSQLIAYLDGQHAAGRLAYGLHQSPAALVTCLVHAYPDNHMHFVDGSDGGYAMAARQLKQQIQTRKAARNAGNNAAA